MKNEAMYKWISGHRLFFVITHAAIMCLDDLGCEAIEERRDSCKKMLMNLATLMQLSASAMRYAGDYSRETYQNFIRPSMPENFSGIDNIDHASMMKSLAAIKRAARQLQCDFSSEYSNFKSSLKQAYDAHIWVCERFVSDAGSLRTQASELPAVQVLEKFRSKRLALLDHET